MAKTAVILAAGRGSRLDPGGQEQSFAKPLMQLGGMTLLERCIRACRTSGARRIVVVTGFRSEHVTREAKRVSRGDVICVENRDWKLSNGVSLLACKPHVGGDFALMMSDHVFESSMLADMMALTPVPGSVTLAVDYKVAEVFDLDDATKVCVADGRIHRIGKALAEYDAIDCGLFLCTPAIFDALETVRAERGDCSLSDGMQRLGESRMFFPFDVGARRWQDVDTPEMASQALALVAQINRPQPGLAKAI